VSQQHNSIFAIVADVGGTHVRFGALPQRGVQLQCIEAFNCSDFAQLDDAIQHYLTLISQQLPGSGPPQVVCLALAGDTQNDPVQLVNAPWNAHIERLSSLFGCQVLAINDFSAQGYAIPGFGGSDLQWLRPPTQDVAGLNRAIVGPGTGLGVAALLPGGQIVESEGGHISFAPQNREQQQLLQVLWQLYPRVSVERLISGPGLATLYRCLSLIDGKEQQLQPEQITQQALAGDSLCLAALELFTQIFGSVAGDLALTMAAKGGVYLSGGLLAGMGQLFDSSSFLKNFDNKGRYRDYCHEMPVARVLAPQPGLLGAARYAELNAETGS
jgi:glucokinase